MGRPARNVAAALPQASPIKNILNTKAQLGGNTTQLSFELDDGLVYRVDSSISDHAFRPRRLYLPPAVVGHVEMGALKMISRPREAL